MRQIIRCLILICAIASAKSPLNAAPTSVPLPAWTTRSAASGWTFSDIANVTVSSESGTPVLSVIATTGGGNVNASLPLPMSAVRGATLQVTVDAKALNVSKPARPYNGIKAMIHSVGPSRSDVWDQAAANGAVFPANYDWKPLVFRTTIAADAVGATLVLGLQDSTGKVDFRNLRMTIVRRLVSLPSVPTGGIRYTGHGPGALRGVMVSPTIKADDIQALQNWGVNVVRYQLMWNGFPNSPADTADLPAYEAWLETSLAQLDGLLPQFAKAGVLVVIDLHTPPGGRAPDYSHRIFTDAKWQNAFGEVWTNIATRYRDQNQVWGYDLVNEPVVGAGADGLLDWQDLAEKTAALVRRIDPRHAIIIEPDPGGSVASLAYFKPLDVPNIVYSVHMYSPIQFTHQGVIVGYDVGPEYPGVIAGTLWNKEQLRRNLQSVIDWSRAYNADIYVGEFSAVRWAKGADRYLGDVIDIFEENHWDWSYHAFREWQGWNPEIGEDKAVTAPSPTPTARLRVLQGWFAKNAVESNLRN